MNSGGIRADLVENDENNVTYGAAFAVQPFNSVQALLNALAPGQTGCLAPNSVFTSMLGYQPFAPLPNVPDYVVTYAGKALFYYAHEGPGEVLCHNVNENGGLWLVVTPKGDPAPA